jgi:hypothetical protein
MNFFRRLIQGKIDDVKDWRDPDRSENPMACDEVTLTGIDPALYANLLSSAASAGMIFSGAVARFRDFTFDWNYDPPSATLRYTCTKKPFYASCGTVDSHINDLITHAKGGI